MFLLCVLWLAYNVRIPLHFVLHYSFNLGYLGGVLVSVWWSGWATLYDTLLIKQGTLLHYDGRAVVSLTPCPFYGTHPPSAQTGKEIHPMWCGVQADIPDELKDGLRFDVYFVYSLPAPTPLPGSVSPSHCCVTLHSWEHFFLGSWLCAVPGYLEVITGDLAPQASMATWKNSGQSSR